MNTPATLNQALKVQKVTETVQVMSQAPLVNTEDASIGHAFTADQMTTLPFEGRDPVSILSLQPGVLYTGNSSDINPDADSRSGAVSGARSDQTNVTVDGLDDNDPVLGYAFQGALRSTLDSLEEFRVTTTNSNADSGRSSGAQVSLVTKSGTNNFHGPLYEYNRSKIGEANNWFNERAQLRRAIQTCLRIWCGTHSELIDRRARSSGTDCFSSPRTRDSEPTKQQLSQDLCQQQAFASGILIYQCDNGRAKCNLPSQWSVHPQ